MSAENIENERIINELNLDKDTCLDQLEKILKDEERLFKGKINIIINDTYVTVYSISDIPPKWIYLEDDIRAFCLEKGWAHANIVLREDSMHLQLLPTEVKSKQIKNTNLTGERIAGMIQKIHSSSNKDLDELWNFIDTRLPCCRIVIGTDVRVIEIPRRWLPYYEQIRCEYKAKGWEDVLLSSPNHFDYQLEFIPVTMMKTYKFNNNKTKPTSSKLKDIFNRIKKYLLAIHPF
jgi:hypothetical protein